MTTGEDAGRDGGRTAARWAVVGCTAAVAALIVVVPWLLRDRLPDRLATHWSGGAAPDGSMPFRAASLFPAAIWLLVVLAVGLRWRRSWPTRRTWVPVALAPTATILVGAQISVVLANLDRTHWHDARQPTAGIAVTLALAALTGVVTWRLTVRSAATAPPAPGPELPLADDEQVVWFSRVSNPWLQLLAALTGLLTVATAVALALGLAAPAALWPVLLGGAVVSVATALCSSVQAKVSEAGLDVAFGPFGRPTRRWAPAAIESARAEQRLPSQVGGWGYRLSSLGTTVMLRAGDCLVIRPRGRRTDFAVSVDDAERGAALLNALRARQRP
ncbi:DUF1648 domain-containing protein [Streptomyces sp. NPDC014006]|uniref:DUF1648 domain-containing protein n=1 Tax=Streptomyces sp. NPDC014006 TaxID=3364870 RepID=UPI0036FA6D60